MIDSHYPIESVRKLQRLALWGLLPLLLVAIFGFGGLKFNTHFSVYFDLDDQKLLEHLAIADSYRLGDSALIILRDEKADFTQEDNYFLLERLTNRLGSLPYAISAHSITTLGISGEEFSTDGLLIPSRTQITEHRLARGLLISEDFHIAVVQVEFQLPDHNANTLLEAMAQLRMLVQNETSNTGLEAHYSGTLVMNAAYIDVVQKDLQTILPLLLFLMVALLSWLLKSIKAMLTIIPIGLLSVVVSFGLVGCFGVSLAAINSFVPVMILSISVAACVHMVTSYGFHRSLKKAPAESAVAAWTENILPLSLATLTTTLGFLGLLLSPSPPVRLVGVLVAGGVALSCFLCMTLLPALLMWIDPKQNTSAYSKFQMGLLGKFVKTKAMPITLIFSLILIPASWLATQNVINDNVFEYFPKTHRFHQDTLLFEKHLSGINRVLYSVDSNKVNSVFSDSFYTDIDAFSNWLKQQPEVSRVSSMTDISQLTEARNAGRLSDRLQYFQSVLSNQNSNQVFVPNLSGDYSAALVSVYLHPLDSSQMIGFNERVEKWSNTHLPAYQLMSGGAALLFAYLGENNIRGMITALAAGLVLASLLLGVFQRSIRIALIAFVCNIFPVLLIYALWALNNGRISLGAAMVMGMILGIVVDDTIYLLSSYKDARQHARQDAVMYALNRVGPALIISSITLVAGLSLGLFSDFGPIWNMALLSISIIATALITDLLLLPAMLALLNRPAKTSGMV